MSASHTVSGKQVSSHHSSDSEDFGAKGSLNSRMTTKLLGDRVATQKTKSESRCCGTVAKWVGIAAAVTLFVIGTIGLLVYLNKLSIGWQGVGNISQQMGLYGMLGGLGASAIITILLTVSCCMNRAGANAQQTRQLHRQEETTQI